MAPKRLRLPVKRKKPRTRFSQTHSSVQNASENAFWLKTLMVLTLLCIVIAIGAIRACVSDKRQAEAARRQATIRDSPSPKPAAERPGPPKKRLVSRPRTAFATAPNVPAEAAVDTPAPSPAESEPQSGNDTPSEEPTPAKMQKVILTDAVRISTRSDGTIEVPRTFSYAGAGLKRPFWIYDRQLEKSGRIKHEAQAEKKARDRWQALHDEAVRQEAAARDAR